MLHSNPQLIHLSKVELDKIYRVQNRTRILWTVIVDLRLAAITARILSQVKGYLGLQQISCRLEREAVMDSCVMQSHIDINIQLTIQCIHT